jgi:hypothetical protein
MHTAVVSPTGSERAPHLPLVVFGRAEVRRASHTPWAPLLVLAAAYLMLRVGALSHAVIVEDHDSVGYLYEIQAFLSRDLSRILNLGIDSTPVFPALGALFALPGWGAEMGARLSSVFSSLILFVALAVVGHRLVGWRATLAALVLLTFCPVLIGLSISILTEPSYIATVYTGIALYWIWAADPRPWRGLVLGLVFGLTFVNRFEGLLFLAAIPVFQLLTPLLERPRPYPLRRLVPWAAAYAFGFAVLAIPQVWNVSRQAGTFIINGRQVWSAVLSAPGPRYEERIYGLSYSPGQVNIDYLEAHPGADLAALASSTPQYAAQPAAASGAHPGHTRIAFRQYTKLFLTNFDTLSLHRLGELFGPAVLILFGIGLVELCRVGAPRSIITVVGLMVVMLAAPLLHNVIPRHVAIIAPMVLLLAGAGAVEITRRFETIPRRSRVLLATLGILVLGAWLIQLEQLGAPARCNREYCPGDLAAPARTLSREAGRDSHPRIVSRRLYFPYYAGGVKVSLPYTDLAGLGRYLDLNGARFLFLDEASTRKYPFYREFTGDVPPAGFELLYQGRDAWGREMRLFRFTPSAPVTASRPSS